MHGLRLTTRVGIAAGGSIFATMARGSAPIAAPSPGRSSGARQKASVVNEVAPCGAAVSDDVVVALEDPVPEPVVAHELPEVFDRVEFGRARRVRPDGDVRWDDKGPGGAGRPGRG